MDIFSHTLISFFLQILVVWVSRYMKCFMRDDSGFNVQVSKCWWYKNNWFCIYFKAHWCLSVLINESIVDENIFFWLTSTLSQNFNWWETKTILEISYITLLKVNVCLKPGILLAIWLGKFHEECNCAKIIK